MTNQITKTDILKVNDLIQKLVAYSYTINETDFLFYGDFVEELQKLNNYILPYDLKNLEYNLKCLFEDMESHCKWEEAGRYTFCDLVLTYKTIVDLLGFEDLPDFYNEIDFEWLNRNGSF